MKLYYIAIATLFSMFASVATAGTTTVNYDTGTGHDCKITFQGSIESGDEYSFNAELAALDEQCDDNVLVVIETPGGDRAASVAMYEAIVAADADTYTDSYAISGGAIMWLGGETRYITRDAEVGFHFAYSPGTDEFTEVQLYHIIANNADYFVGMTPWDRKGFIDQLKRDLAQGNIIRTAWEDIKFYADVQMIDNLAFIDLLVEEGVGSIWFLSVDEYIAENIIGNVVYVEDIKATEVAGIEFEEEPVTIVSSDNMLNLFIVDDRFANKFLFVEVLDENFDVLPSRNWRSTQGWQWGHNHIASSSGLIDLEVTGEAKYLRVTIEFTSTTAIYLFKTA